LTALLEKYVVYVVCKDAYLTHVTAGKTSLQNSILIDVVVCKVI